MRKPWAVPLLLLVGACTTPVAPESAREVAALKAGAGTSSITVTRDGGPIGSACTFHIGIDGAPAGDLNPGERFSLRVEPGSHEVKASNSDWCGGALQYYTAATRSGVDTRISIGTTMGQAIVLRHDADATIETAAEATPGK